MATARGTECLGATSPYKMLTLHYQRKSLSHPQTKANKHCKISSSNTTPETVSWSFQTTTNIIPLSNTTLHTEDFFAFLCFGNIGNCPWCSRHYPVPSWLLTSPLTLPLLGECRANRAPTLSLTLLTPNHQSTHRLAFSPLTACWQEQPTFAFSALVSGPEQGGWGGGLPILWKTPVFRLSDTAICTWPELMASW